MQAICVLLGKGQYFHNFESVDVVNLAVRNIYIYIFFNMSVLCLCNDRAVTWRRPLLAERLIRRNGFDSMPGHDKFLLHELAVG